MSSTAPMIDKEAIARDMAQALEGKMDQAKIDAAVQRLKSFSTSYGASGSVWSAVLYMGFEVTINGGETFKGKAWGISLPGGGAFFGSVFTDDINALYANTETFQFNGTAAWLNINFFDGHGNLLGNLQAGAVSTVLGMSGGSGSWS